MIRKQIPIEIEKNIYIYEEIIQKLGDLFMNLGFDNDVIKIYENFRYMYTNGFLSCDKKYFECLKNEIVRLETDGFIPMDFTGSILMTNYGVCRHTTDFLYHLYDYLHYDSSQLFTYRPDIQINITNNGDDFLTNWHAQKIIDNIVNDIDLFSQKEVHIRKSIEEINVKIDYQPSDYKINHTINIVESEDGSVHILDTRYHSIGKKINDNRILLDDLGLKHIEFIQDKVDFCTYSDTNYYHGLQLVKNNNTNLEKDVLSSILFRHSCEEYIEYYEEFWRTHQKSFQEINNNYNLLIKRII